MSLRTVDNSHPEAVEIASGLAGAFVDREAETRGLDWIDRVRRFGLYLLSATDLHFVCRKRPSVKPASRFNRTSPRISTRVVVADTKRVEKRLINSVPIPMFE